MDLLAESDVEACLIFETDCIMPTYPDELDGVIVYGVNRNYYERNQGQEEWYWPLEEADYQALPGGPIERGNANLKEKFAFHS